MRQAGPTLFERHQVLDFEKLWHARPTLSKRRLASNGIVSESLSSQCVQDAQLLSDMGDCMFSCVTST